ncbi:osmotically inducible protein OsmC [Fodinibius salinus]|uniref:Osmotically inducible protein OsmC n=1 Tax=Fodinibius salinus TaxID=860790 RepID=A0A5D3YLI8_9BACT|nr:OsmC family protein [Fodinibius salinus]TYP94814.1 osmotically inducible protein OsmC [Fodinibius salinus]
MPTRKANAQWNGDLENGNGTMKLESGSYKGEYSFASRFESGNGTNPEELIGAAHAGCYSMALSNELAQAGYDPKSVETEANVTFEVTDDGPAITKIKLITKANISDIDEDTFQQFANGAKDGCPVSKALSGTEILLDASLTG